MMEPLSVAAIEAIKVIVAHETPPRVALLAARLAANKPDQADAPSGVSKP